MNRYEYQSIHNITKDGFCTLFPSVHPSFHVEIAEVRLFHSARSLHPHQWQGAQWHQALQRGREEAVPIGCSPVEMENDGTELLISIEHGHLEKILRFFP